MGNLTDKSLVDGPKLTIANVKLLHVNKVASYAAYIYLHDMGLPGPNILINLPSVDEALAPSDNRQV